MYYLIKSRRTIVDKKGNDKSVTEAFLVENIETFAEAEYKGLELFNNENDVFAISQSKVREFVNKRASEEQSIYMATIEDIFVDDNGDEKATKYVVGLFATSVEEATKMTAEYMKQGLNDLSLVGIKKTKIVDII